MNAAGFYPQQQYSQQYPQQQYSQQYPQQQYPQQHQRRIMYPTTTGAQRNSLFF